MAMGIDELAANLYMCRRRVTALFPRIRAVLPSCVCLLSAGEIRTDERRLVSVSYTGIHARVLSRCLVRADSHIALEPAKHLC